MNTKVKGNNKGFSLVELIVVMAIMAILAVTLTPRLSQYIDKARQSNDREAVNAVYTAIKLGMLDDEIFADVPAATGTTPVPTVAPYTIELRKDASTNLNGLYTVTGKQWVSGTTSNKFLNEIKQVLGDFKLQAKDAGATTEITIIVESASLFRIELDYTADGTADYSVDSRDVAIN